MEENELLELQETIKTKMQNIGNDVNTQIPEGFGFAVLIFPFGEQYQGELMYVSNANRLDIVNVMKEFIEKTEENYGNDTGKY